MARGDAQKSAPSKPATLDYDLIHAHLGLCESLARRYSRRGLDYEDLVQVARAGLIYAARRYRPEQGDFVAFAIPTITGELKRYFRDYGWVVRPPRRIQELRARAEERRRAAEQERQGTVSREQLAAQLGVAVEEIAECENVGPSFRPLSLDAPMGGSDVGQLEQQIAYEDKDLEALPDLLSLRSALAKLNERDRMILAWRFIDGETQGEIGQRLGVSQMQVSRIISRLMTKIRTMLEPPEELAA